MDYNDLKEGNVYWTMKGNRPVQVELISMRSEKVHKQIRNLSVWHKEKGTTHSRYHWDLFNTYEDLKNDVFPNLKK